MEPKTSVEDGMEQRELSADEQMLKEMKEDPYWAVRRRKVDKPAPACKEDEEFRASMQRIREQYVARNAAISNDPPPRPNPTSAEDMIIARACIEQFVLKASEPKATESKFGIKSVGLHGSSDEPTPEPQPSKRPRTEPLFEKELPPTPSATSDSD